MKKKLVYVSILGMLHSGCCTFCKFETPGPPGSNIVYLVEPPTIYRCKLVKGEIDQNSKLKITKD
jgi:hypothetical protein